MTSFTYADLMAIADEQLSFKDGMYRMAVQYAEWGVTSTGKDKLKITLVCTEGEKVGETVKWHLTVSTEKPGYFLSRLDILGADREFLSKNPSNAELVQRIVSSREYLVGLKNGNWNGRATIDVVGIQRVD